MIEQTFHAPPLPERPRQVLKTLRLLLLDFLLALALLASVELALERLAPEYGDHLFDAGFTGGHPLGLNSRGLRGPEVPPQKRPRELRILGLGDSTTFGTGVAWEATWPYRAGKRLSSLTPRPVTAINGGVEGVSLKDLSVAMEGSWGSWDSQVVVVAISGNMVSLAWLRRGDAGTVPAFASPSPAVTASSSYKIKTLINRQLHRLCLPTFLTINSERALLWAGIQGHEINPDAPYGPLLAHGWQQLGLNPELPGEAWRLFEEDLMALRDRIVSRGARFYVTALPCRFMLTEDWRDNEKRIPRHRLSLVPTDRVRQICERRGMRYIDAVQALRTARETAAQGGAFLPLYRQGDYMHFDDQGHDALAQAIAERVATEILPQ